MKLSTTLLVCLLALFVVMSNTQMALATTSSSGQSTHIPWSASYYPIKKGELHQGYLPDTLSPLEKYDRYTNQDNKATDWERDRRPMADAEYWHGYCHAWAAASMLLSEPQFPRYDKDKDISFNVGDLKGYFLVAGYVPLGKMQGKTFGRSPYAVDTNLNDISPAIFEYWLEHYIGKHKKNFIMDRSNGPKNDPSAYEVWNHPIYKYELTKTKTPTASGWKKDVIAQVWYAIEAKNPDLVGTCSLKQVYRYVLEDTNGDNKVDTSYWVDPNEEDHPDYLWFPTGFFPASSPEVASGEDPNPYVAIDTVFDILQHSPIERLAQTSQADQCLYKTGKTRRQNIEKGLVKFSSKPSLYKTGKTGRQNIEKGLVKFSLPEVNPQLTYPGKSVED